MPNWCENRLTVRGDKKEVEKFRNFILSDDPEKKYELFGKLIPMPEELKETIKSFGNSESNEQLIEKYGYDNWYDWCIANWGVKWDISHVFDHSDGENNIDVFPITTYEGEKIGEYAEFSIGYDTPWGPGDDELEKAFQKFDQLRFFLYYSEPGMGFHGYLYVVNGETAGREAESRIVPNFIDAVDFPNDYIQKKDGK
jgi:hypothetical protein